MDWCVMTPEQSARLDAHEREISGMREGQSKIWQDLNKTGRTLAEVTTKVANQGEDISEIKDDLKAIRDGQRTQTQWLITATFSGLGLILVLGLWLAERLS